MKKTYLYIATVFFLVVACKKQPTDFKPDNATLSEVQQSNISNPCYGNTWTVDQDYVGHLSSPHLVYNNKVYFFNYLESPQLPNDRTITIYDGTSWQVLPSNIPEWMNNLTNIRFVIGNKGYLGKTNGAFYEYNFITNTWAEKATFPGPHRLINANFSIGSRGYIIGGYLFKDNQHLNYSDTWEYSPLSNTWNQKASIGIFGIGGMTGFTIGNKGYVVNGATTLNAPASDILYNSLLEYNQSTDTWTAKAHFPGTARWSSKAFVISGYAYVGCGTITNSTNEFTDFYKYNPSTNSWTRVADIEVDGFESTSLYKADFALNSKGYIKWRYTNSLHKLQKYTPRTCPPVVGPTP